MQRVLRLVFRLWFGAKYLLQRLGILKKSAGIGDARLNFFYKTWMINRNVYITCGNPPFVANLLFCSGKVEYEYIVPFGREMANIHDRLRKLRKKLWREELEAISFTGLHRNGDDGRELIFMVAISRKESIAMGELGRAAGRVGVPQGVVMDLRGTEMQETLERYGKEFLNIAETLN